MQKKWPLLVGLLVIVLASFWFFKSPRPASPEGNGEAVVLGPTLSYETRVVVRQRVEGQGEATVIDIKGLLNQASEVGRNYLTQWQRIDDFVLMNKEQDKSIQDNLLGKSIDSHFAPNDKAFAHSFQADFPKDFIPFHASLLHRTLLPMTLDELRKAQRISTKERDEVGEYEAVYSIEGAKVTKRWTRYMQDMIKVDGKQNSFVFTFAGDDRLESVQGDLVLHYRQATPTRFQIVIEMKLAGQSDKVVAKVDAKSAVVYSESDIAKGVESAPQSVVSFDEAIKLVDSITDTSDSAEAFRIFSSLKYALDQDPSRAKEVIARIEATKDRDPSSRRRLSVLFGALSQAKDSGISNSLADMAESCPDNFCKIQAIAGVNSHPNPTGEAMDKMLSIAEKSPDAEIAGNALLAAGAAGSRMDNVGAELASTLIKTANDPAKTAIKGAAIAAMGNHGSAEYLAVLEKGIADPSTAIRSASAYSMRYIPDSSVDKTLIRIVNTDKDQIVVRDALKALDYRSLSSDDYQAIAKKTVAINDAETQKIGARVLIQAYREDPSVVESTINEMSGALKDPDVKQYLDTEVEKIKADRAAAAAPAPQ